MLLVSTLPPNFSAAEVETFVQERYGIEAGATPLVGDIGQNFYLREPEGREFVFKIANLAEGWDILEAQNSVLQNLAEQELSLRCPEILASLDGLRISTIQDTEGKTFAARLLTYLPGTFLAELRDHPPELLRSVGKSLGEVDKALAEHDHPGTHRYWHWDLLHTGDLMQHTQVISDPRRRTLVEHFLLHFDTVVRPALPELRRGIIHNDGNDHNLLVTNGEKSQRVSGLIDFGDMVHSCVVFEVAIACAYAMLSKADPLEAAQHVLEGYHATYPLEDAELDLLYWLICARLCQSVTIAAYQQQLRPDETYLGVSEAPAWSLLEELFSVSPDLAKHRFYEACNRPAPQPAGLDPECVLHVRATHLGPSLSVAYQQPLKIVRGAGQYLFDAEGRRYLDCVNNVCHVGHCHPKVVQALQKQAAVLNTNTRYLHDHLACYVQELTAQFPESLEVCYLVNSGSEANELALRLARTHTGQQDCLVLDHGYHGNTSLLVSLSHYKFAGPGGQGPGPVTCSLPMPDTYRGPYKADDPDACRKYAQLAEDAIEHLLNRGRKPAAFLCESLLGCGGQIVLPKGYLQRVFAAVRAAGGVCIADEVQVGFGRVGTHFSAFETQGVVPDIVTLGKPIGNGHPLAAVVCTREIAASFNTGMEYFNTFGGNPVSCAVGLAVLEVLQEEKLQDNALRVGNYLLAGLEKLRKHELVGDVRGLGLYLGVELVTDRDTLNPASSEAGSIIERMKEEGVLLSIDGPLHNVLKIKPPIVLNEGNADELVEKLDNILRAGV